MVTLEQLVARAQGELGPLVDREVVECVVKSTLAGLDMHVDDNGEVCDPRPRQVINYPHTNGARWNGSRRRSGGRR